MKYIISKEKHGFMVRDANGDRDGLYSAYIWCYSTLEEALEGLHDLLAKEEKSNEK